MNSGQISIFVSQESKDTHTHVHAHTHTHTHTQYWNVGIHKLWWASWPSPASGTLQPGGPLTTCWDRKGTGTRIAP